MTPEREPTVREESVDAPAVREPSVAPPTALSWPAMVEEDVTERSEVVAESVLMPVNWEVVEAWIPFVKSIVVEVAFTPTPKLVVGVNGAFAETVTLPVEPESVTPEPAVRAVTPELVKLQVFPAKEQETPEE